MSKLSVNMTEGQLRELLVQAEYTEAKKQPNFSYQQLVEEMSIETWVADLSLAEVKEELRKHNYEIGE